MTDIRNWSCWPKQWSPLKRTASCFCLYVWLNWKAFFFCSFFGKVSPDDICCELPLHKWTELNSWLIFHFYFQSFWRFKALAEFVDSHVVLGAFGRETGPQHHIGQEEPFPFNHEFNWSVSWFFFFSFFFFTCIGTKKTAPRFASD